MTYNLFEYPSRENNESRIAFAVQTLSLGNQREVMERVRALGSFDALLGIPEISHKIRKTAAERDPCEIASSVPDLKVISFTSPRYPELLRMTNDPPPLLFIKTRQEIPSEWPATISIVGSRKASLDFCSVTVRLARTLAEAGFCVVSGLALGIDGAAHRGALQSTRNFSTASVLAHGLDRTYPSSHEYLANQIINNGGMLISEYEPGVAPLKHHFLRRNRLIAGLSTATVVVQAGEKSGSLVTAQYGVDNGRDVFVLRSSHEDTTFAGGDRLIEDGAVPITSAQEILAAYGVTESDDDSRASGKKILLTVHEFQSDAGVTSDQLVQLELDGKIIRLPANKLSVAESELIRLRTSKAQDL